ncbi:MAG: hypothetical protein P9M12_01235 [Candidatus Aceula lacicola]|nr:hypothetical protein [Candidatus Aceula lacicola]
MAIRKKIGGSVKSSNGCRVNRQRDLDTMQCCSASSVKYPRRTISSPEI